MINRMGAKVAALAVTCALIGAACSTPAASTVPTAAPATAAAVASAPPASTAPASAAPASAAPSGPRLAGKRECISSIINIEILNIFYDDMKAEINNAGLGINVTIVDAKGDIVKQLQDVEQMVAGSDCDAIATVTSISPEAVTGWQKAADDAKAKNVCFVNHSSETVNNAVTNISQPHDRAGTILGTEAGQWYKLHGAKGSVLTTRNTVSSGLTKLTDAFMAAFKAEVNDPAVKFYDAEASKGTVEQGAAVTSNLLAAHPDATVLFAWGADISIGASQVLNEAGKTDQDKFWMGTANVNDAQIGDIIAGKGILQTAATYSYRFSAIAFQRALERCMLGESGIPPSGSVYPIIIDKNSAEFLRASNHQFLPENKKWYSETTKWWATPVKTFDEYPPDSAQIKWEGAEVSP